MSGVAIEDPVHTDFAPVPPVLQPVGDLSVPIPFRAPAIMCEVPVIDLRNATKVERFEAQLLALPQAKYEMRHFHQPGVYLRGILMFAGTDLVGAEHVGEHFNIVMKGRAIVSMDGAEPQEIVGPCIFRSAAGVRKALRILEDTWWITAHANPENIQDIQVLEEIFTRKSGVYQQFHEVMKNDRFRDHAAQFKPAKEEVFT